jgi:hypothetical protein
MLLEVVPVALGALLLYIGLTYLWSSPLDNFALTAVRFSHELPIDNYIPTLFADRLQAGLSTHLIVGDWNGSDRPPLQAGLILLTRSLGGGLFGPTTGALGASIAAQLLWVPALYAALRAWGVRRRLVPIVLVFVTVTGTTLLNSVFTWPKLLSAALVLCSIALLLEARRHPRGLTRHLLLAVILFAFAALAHGAAAFAAPLLVVLGIRALHRQAIGTVLRTLALSMVGGIAVYLPWLLYQRFVDPPGDRLLKWHLGGVTTGDPRGAVQLIVDSYSQLTFNEWAAGRLANLATLFGPDPFRDVSCYCSSLAERRGAEFFSTSAALGLAFPLIIVVLTIIGIRLLRQRSLTAADRRFLVMVGGSLLCIVVWCVVMFIPRSTVVHQGSQVWVFLLLVAPVIWLAERRLVLAAVAAALQATIFAAVYVPTVTDEPLNVRAVLVVVLGIVAIVSGSILATRGRWRSRARPSSLQSRIPRKRE